jgi:uncharacterized protein
VLAGIISDTHGYLDPQLESLFAGVDIVLHAGDIGKPEVLDGLAEIGPVLAVRGNVDLNPRLLTLPERRNLTLAGVSIQLVHRPQDADPPAGTRVVIFGHTHRALCEWRQNILFLNPGAAGRQGFHRERTACLLEIDENLLATPLSLGSRSQRLSDAKRSVL